jgi:uncharacterized protein YcfJ
MRKTSLFSFLALAVLLTSCSSGPTNEVFEHLSNYVDVVSVTITKDELNPNSPNPQSKEYNVQFAAKLKDGQAITGTCAYNQGTQILIRNVHIDGDGPEWTWVGSPGSRYKPRFQK